MAASVRYGGGSDGWVVPSDTRLVEDSEGNVATGPLGAFGHASTSGFDVTIDTGEALVGGAHLATDDQHDVDLSTDAAGQTVYVGWQDSAADTVLVGLDGAFADDDPKIPIWEFDTDSSTVTSSTDLRTLRRTLTPEAVDATEEVAAPTGDFDALQGTTYTEPVEDLTADSGYLSLPLDESNWFEAGVESDLSMWNTLSESPISEGANAVNSVAFGEGYLAYGNDGSAVHVHDTSDWSDETTLTEAGADVLTVAFGDGYIAYGGEDDNVYVHNTSDWSLEATLTEAGVPVQSVAFGDGYIAYGGNSNNVYVHDTSDWSLVTTLTEAGDLINSVAFGDGYLAYGGEDNNVYVHDTSSFALLETTLEEAIDAVSSVAFGEGHIAYGDDDQAVHIHNTSDWSLEEVLAPNPNSVNSVAFGDGYIANCNDDNDVYVHTAPDWSDETTLSEAGGSVNSVAFSDEYVAYGGDDDSVHVHQIDAIYPVPAGEEGNSFMLYMEDGDGNGPYTLHWPGGVLWRGGDAYTEIPQNGNAELAAITPDGGDTWRASVRGEDWS